MNGTLIVAPSQNVAVTRVVVDGWMQWFWNTRVGRWADSVYYVIVVYPLERLFLKWYWSGRDAADMCAQLTNTPSTHWRTIDGVAACEEVIFRNFEIWKVMVDILLYGLLIVWTYHKLVKILSFLCRKVKATP